MNPLMDITGGELEFVMLDFFDHDVAGLDKIIYRDSGLIEFKQIAAETMVPGDVGEYGVALKCRILPGSDSPEVLGVAFIRRDEITSKLLPRFH